jgi:Uma2 family endonuclease
MTAVAGSLFTVSPAEYLKSERRANHKSEYFGGVVVAMAGASWQHNLITANIARLLGNQLVDGPCAVVSSDLRVLVPECDRYYYPDVVLVCDEPEFEDTTADSLLNPNVVVEVLSNSTERLDREQKYDCYRTLRSLTDYVLVSQTHRRIEHFSRQPDGRWVHSVVTAPEGELEIPAIRCKLSLAEVYARVKLSDEATGEVAATK